MSVLYEQEGVGWVIDSRAQLDDSYRHHRVIEPISSNGDEPIFSFSLALPYVASYRVNGNSSSTSTRTRHNGDFLVKLEAADAVAEQVEEDYRRMRNEKKMRYKNNKKRKIMLDHTGERMRASERGEGSATSGFIFRQQQHLQENAEGDEKSRRFRVEERLRNLIAASLEVFLQGMKRVGEGQCAAFGDNEEASVLFRRERANDCNYSPVAENKRGQGWKRKDEDVCAEVEIDEVTLEQAILLYRGRECRSLAAVDAVTVLSATDGADGNDHPLVLSACSCRDLKEKDSKSESKWRRDGTEPCVCNHTCQRDCHDCERLLRISFPAASSSSLPMQHSSSRCFRDFLLPSRSAFLQCDIAYIQTLNLLRPASGYRIIVADPPWQCKSVRRSNAYKTLETSSLLSLPVDSLLDREQLSVVAVWVSNNPSIQDFVLSSLFPKWGVRHAATWCWLKVTDSGVPVFPLLEQQLERTSANHRKPYEFVLIGVTHPPNRLGEGGREGAEGHERREQVPVRVLCSVPGTRTHSRKPQLGLLLRQFLRGFSQGQKQQTEGVVGEEEEKEEKEEDAFPSLELFARNLVRGWHSWGNECLRFQETFFFAPSMMSLAKSQSQSKPCID